MALMTRWSAAYDWVARSAAWDSYLDKHVQAKGVSDAQKRAQEIVRQARNFQLLPNLPAAEWARRQKDEPDTFKRLPADELAVVQDRLDRVAHRAFQREQVVTGGVSDRIGVEGTFKVNLADVSKITQSIEEELPDDAGDVE